MITILGGGVAGVALTRALVQGFTPEMRSASRRRLYNMLDCERERQESDKKRCIGRQGEMPGPKGVWMG